MHVEVASQKDPSVPADEARETVETSDSNNLSAGSAEISDDEPLTERKGLCMVFERMSKKCTFLNAFFTLQKYISGVSLIYVFLLV